MQDKQNATRWIVVAAIVYPTILTLAYFRWRDDAGPLLQRGVFQGGKLLQFLLPAVWVWWVLKQKPGWSRPNRRGLLENLVFGGTVVAAMLLLYHLLLAPWGVFDRPLEQIMQKVEEMGVDRPALFIALGVFYALGPSLLEEYYWRWFVFGRLREWVAVPWAIAISSLGFMAHHVVLMATFFGLFSFWAFFFSASVAVGGLFWAWSYQRTGSLYGPWLGHLLVDAGIFIIGYDLVF